MGIALTPEHFLTCCHTKWNTIWIHADQRIWTQLHLLELGDGLIGTIVALRRLRSFALTLVCACLEVDHPWPQMSSPPALLSAPIPWHANYTYLRRS